MVGIIKFMRKFKKANRNMDISDEEIINIWMENASRGSIYYYKAKLENPNITDDEISREYIEELVNIKIENYNKYNHGNQFIYLDYVDIISKNFDCGCKYGEKCPVFYRYKYEKETYSRELDMDHPWRFDHYPYIITECVGKIRSKKYCNFYKNLNITDMYDMVDTKPAREI